MIDSPAAPSKTSLAISPAWRIIRQADTVRCTGGPDELHVLSDLSTTTLDAIEQWTNESAVVATPTEELVEAQNFLVSVGALIDNAAIESPGALSWHTVGPSAVTERIERVVAAAAPRLPAEDLAIVVRSGGLLADLIDTARSLAGKRQLLIDLTGHHTISLGPFAVAGYTSCIGCYCDRITRRWGDELGAPEPASQRWAAVAGELVAVQIALISAGASPLLNATINWDLQTAASSRDHLLRAPQCSLCRPDLSGSFPLPWSPQ